MHVLASAPQCKPRVVRVSLMHTFWRGHSARVRECARWTGAQASLAAKETRAKMTEKQLGAQLAELKKRNAELEQVWPPSQPRL